MGLCYSKKTSQMSQQGEKMEQKSHSTSTGLGKMTSQRGRGGFSSFGFHHKKQVEKKPEADDSRKPSSKEVMQKNENSSKVPQTTPKNRFGFKRSTAKKADSHAQKSDSVECLRSNLSEKCNKSENRRDVRPSSAVLQRKDTSNAVRSKMDKNFKMIDDTGSSHSTLTSEIRKIPDNSSPVFVPRAFEVNANIPDSDKNLVIENNEYTNISLNESNSDKNGNNEVHSPQVSDSNTKKSSPGKGISSRLPSKFRRPFGKSKTFSGPHTEKGVENNSKLKQSISKDSALTQEVSKSVVESRPVQARSSFLKKGFFSRPKSNFNSNLASSQIKPDTNSLKERKENLNDEEHISKNDVLGDIDNKKLLSKSFETEQNIPSEVSEDISSQPDTAKLTHTDMLNNPLSNEKQQTYSDVNSRNKNSELVFSPDLQEKLDKSYIPKGIAPIAMLDSVETTSIGSINSDDLMLDLDLDLTVNDDDELRQSFSSKRTRSTSQSGRLRSRSRSHEKPHKKETRNVLEKTNMAEKSSNSQSYLGTCYEQKPSAHHIVSASGAERRDHWYKKRSDSQHKSNEHESIDELQDLLESQSPNERKYQLKEKPVRPASFPGGIEIGDQVNDLDSPQNSHVLRPPRTSSVTDEDNITMDSFTYRHMAQDLTTMKTMLFKLKRVIQDDDLASPIGTSSWKNGLSLNTSQTTSPFSRFTSADNQQQLDHVLKENEELKKENLALKTLLEEKERTIKLLQQQMPKTNQVSTQKPSQQQPDRTTCSQTGKKRLSSTTSKPAQSNLSGKSRPRASVITPNPSNSENKDDSLHHFNCGPTPVTSSPMEQRRLVDRSKGTEVGIKRHLSFTGDHGRGLHVRKCDHKTSSDDSFSKTDIKKTVKSLNGNENIDPNSAEPINQKVSTSNATDVKKVSSQPSRLLSFGSFKGYKKPQSSKLPTFGSFRIKKSQSKS